LCVELERGDLRTLVRAARGGRVLDRVLEVLRTPGAVDDRVRALDALDDLLIRAGVPGGLLSNTREYRPPLGSRGHPVIRVWVCPNDVCDRWRPVEPGEACGPRCAVTDSVLTMKRIAT
jgi:hypothetical protein